MGTSRVLFTALFQKHRVVPDTEQVLNKIWLANSEQKYYYCESLSWEACLWLGIRPKDSDSREFFHIWLIQGSFFIFDWWSYLSIFHCTAILPGYLKMRLTWLHLPEVFMHTICCSYCFLFLSKYLNILYCVHLIILVPYRWVFPLSIEKYMEFWLEHNIA